MLRRVFVTTATGGLSTRTAPVGGGVAVLEAFYPHLAAAPELESWVLQPGPADGEVRAGELRRVTLRVPSLAGRSAEELLALDERGYARFAFEWEAALARFFERVDPAGAVVVANDVSEGPPFEELARRGFAQLVLYHVVVGEFFARQYLRAGRALGLSAPTAARWWRAAERTRLARLQPRLLALVWSKESRAAAFAHGVVPSESMARELAAIYPWTGIAQRTHVVPWGVIGAPELAIRALHRLERDAPALADRLALASGTPALSTDHQGARAILDGRPELGWVVRARERELAEAVRAAVEHASPERRGAAAEWGRANGFEHAARRLLELVRAAQPRSAPAERANTRATR